MVRTLFFLERGKNMKEKWLRTKLNFLYYVSGIYIKLGKKFTKIGQYLLDVQKDIYYEITGKEI